MFNNKSHYSHMEVSFSFMPWTSWVSFCISHSSLWVSVLPNSLADSQAEVGAIVERTAQAVWILALLPSISPTASIHPVKEQFLWPLVIRQVLVSMVETMIMDIILVSAEDTFLWKLQKSLSRMYSFPRKRRSQILLPNPPLHCISSHPLCTTAHEFLSQDIWLKEVVTHVQKISNLHHIWELDEEHCDILPSFRLFLRLKSLSTAYFSVKVNRHFCQHPA